MQGSARAAGWMDKVSDKREACVWRSTPQRKLKRPMSDLLSLRRQTHGQKSVSGGALCLPNFRPSSGYFLSAESEASRMQQFCIVLNSSRSNLQLILGSPFREKISPPSRTQSCPQHLARQPLAQLLTVLPLPDFLTWVAPTHLPGFGQKNSVSNGTSLNPQFRLSIRCSGFPQRPGPLPPSHLLQCNSTASILTCILHRLPEAGDDSKPGL